VSTPFLGEIKIISWNFPPKGWTFCNGQLLPINQNQALFSILGTTYGGDGRVNFALPNLQGRVPVYVGQGFVLGERMGEQFHTLTLSELPQHVHGLNVNTAAASTASSGVEGTTQNPGAGNYLAKPATKMFAAANNVVGLNPTAVGNAGGSQPHENEQPYLVLNIIIALQGIFPSRN
jgi:microcystin-dependent protein